MPHLIRGHIRTLPNLLLSPLSMRSTRAAVVVLALLSFKTRAVQPVPSLGEPALSPDRSEIVFVSGGDIWSVSSKGGEAHLLVSHPATESRPLFSPDGKKLAFASNRTGNGDIYVLTFATGQLSRVTFSDSPELLDGWSHDWKWLYVSSTGNDVGSANDIFRVSAEGGTPLEVSRDRFFNEFRAASSPDGSQIAFVAKGISAAQWWRHGHSHLDESEIWIKQIAEGGAYQCVVEEDAKQGWPMWDPNGHAIFYTSDRSGAENIYAQPAHPKANSTALTHFKDGRLLWPSISYDGREIVFERNFTIWKLDTKSGASSQVPITLRGAVSSPETTYAALTQFSDLALSPDGKKVAVIAHGEVFAASATDGGEALRITQTPSPETTLRWAPDSNRLIYLSARNGHDQIFEYDFSKNAERQVTTFDQDDARPMFSPDGRYLAFVRADRDLHVLTMDANRDRTLASGFLTSPVLAWSPDSRFLAYTSVGAKSFRNVNAVSIEESKPQPISFLANGETATEIAWSPDGRYLVFDTAQRSEPSQMARVDLIPHLPRFREDQFRELFRRTTQPDPGRSPARQPADRDPAKPVDLTPTAADSSPSPLAREEHGSKKQEPTRIVFEGLRERLSFIPLGFDSGQPVISPDGKTLIFAATTGNQRNLYAYPLDELSPTPSTPRQLTSTASPKSLSQFAPDSKQIYFLDGGHVISMPIDTHVSRPINITAHLEIEFRARQNGSLQSGMVAAQQALLRSQLQWEELDGASQFL